MDWCDCTFEGSRLVAKWMYDWTEISKAGAPSSTCEVQVKCNGVLDLLGSANKVRDGREFETIYKTEFTELNYWLDGCCKGKRKMGEY